jgi:penicillin amidase
MCTGYNAYGVSLPGIPGIAIGFNESIAWGETNVGQDVMDWYAIKWVEGKKGNLFVGWPGARSGASG